MEGGEGNGRTGKWRGKKERGGKKQRGRRRRRWASVDISMPVSMTCNDPLVFFILLRGILSLFSSPTHGL